MKISKSPERSKAFLIFEGGGVKGAALVGGLAVAEKHLQISGVGGTSAGAIVAALYAAGYTSEELRTAMLQLPYPKLAKRFFWPRRFGFHSSEFIYTWVRDQISIKLHKTPGHQVTFEQLPISSLKIVAADIRHRKMLIFSKDKTPTMEVAHAVRMSMSIPLFYEMIRDGTGDIVDGGIISNFPIWLFDEERQKVEGAVSVLGFDLVSVEEPQLEIRSFRDYVSAVLDTIITANRNLVERAVRGRRHSSVIQINTGTVKTTDFDIKPATIQWLYEQGSMAATSFFQTQSVSAPERVMQLGDGTRRDEIYAQWHAGSIDNTAALKKFIPYFAYFGGIAQDAGTYQQVLVKYYIDFMEASLDSKALEFLSLIGQQYLQQCQFGDYQFIAGIKIGNPILAVAIAERSSKRIVLTKEFIAPYSSYPFDGHINPGDRAIIVDDVSSDGTFLCQAVRYLRIQGVYINDVVTLVDRTEGNAQAMLARDHCKLHTMLSINDDDIKMLCEKSNR